MSFFMRVNVPEKIQYVQEATFRNVPGGWLRLMDEVLGGMNHVKTDIAWTNCTTAPVCNFHEVRYKPCRHQHSIKDNAPGWEPKSATVSSSCRTTTEHPAHQIGVAAEATTHPMS